MRIYRWLWRACWVPIGTVCAVAGLTLGPLAGPLLLAGLCAVVGGLVAAALESRDPAPPRTAPHGGRARVLRVAGRAALAGGLLEAWSVVLGTTVWPVLALAALTSPGLVAAVVPRSRSERRRAPVPPVATCGCGCADPVTAAEMAALVPVLDDAQLCRAWRASLARLREAPDCAARLQLVALRHAYLEELERRDEVAVRRWLASAPRPASTPADFRRPGPTRAPEDPSTAA